MDVYSFINSTAMQNYLRNINYKFSGFEAAWLIYRSNRATLAEKHAAWQEIIDTWPDEESDRPHMPNSSNSNRYSRYKLHESLKRQIRLDNILVKSITDNNDADGKFYYSYVLCGEGVDEYASSTKFLSYKATYDSAKWYFNNNTEHTKVIIYQTELYDEQEDYDTNRITISRNGDILKVETDAMYVYIPALENLLFEFPTPFKKGDILYDPYSRKEPFVFIKALSNKEVRNHFSHCYLDHYLPKNYVSSYKVDKSGRIDFLDCGGTGEYTSFEYYNGKSDTRTAVLNLLSKHLKSDDDPDGVKFAHAYAQTIAEGWVNRILKRTYEEE